MWERGLKHLSWLIIVEDYVAPHVGAWIETGGNRLLHQLLAVAPHVGAWIETRLQWLQNHIQTVAPHVGAWIETTPMQ